MKTKFDACILFMICVWATQLDQTALEAHGLSLLDNCSSTSIPTRSCNLISSNALYFFFLNRVSWLKEGRNKLNIHMQSFDLRFIFHYCLFNYLEVLSIQILLWKQLYYRFEKVLILFLRLTFSLVKCWYEQYTGHFYNSLSTYFFFSLGFCFNHRILI